MNTRLWYEKEAEAFSQALPLGNGSLGAMVYGTVPQEKIQLNLDTFWSGSKIENVESISQRTLREIKTLLFDGAYSQAQTLVEKKLLGKYNESYMPLGTLCYRLEGINIPNIKEYRRSLDLEKAVSEVSYRSEGARIKSECFISFPDAVFACRIWAETDTSCGGRLSLSVWLESLLPHDIKIEKDHTLFLLENAPSHVDPNYMESECPVVYEDGRPGMAAVIGLKVETVDGTLETDGERLFIKNASEVFLYVTAVDGFRRFDRAAETSPEVIKSSCNNILKGCGGNYKELRGRHLEDYGPLFGRVSLDLKGSSGEYPTDERLERLKTGDEDFGMYCLYFNYGRYLLAASSRTESQPANLQGIWNDSIRPVWSSNWTTNINTEMNYWAACPCNLPECFEPLARMVSELSEAGKWTAYAQYGCGGWVANHNVDLWRQTAPVGGQAKYAYWPMGGVWLTTQVYSYYRYTQDRDFLLGVWPALEGAARFCADWLAEGSDGLYHTAPSTSPENTFLDEEGRECGVGYSSVMDISLIRELFMDLLEAEDALGFQDDLYIEVQRKLERLPSLEMDEQGCLKEWIPQLKEAVPGHRHFSPLVGLYPGRLINRHKQEDLSEGCRKLIQHRLESGSGHIGWSCAWLIGLYARLGAGDEALSFYERLLKESTYPNLFDLHPPLGENDGEREVFQIDANLGSAAGVAELLMQSDGNEIELLPALPGKWKEGSIEGLLAESCFEVSVYWQDSVLIKARILSLHGGRIRIRYARPLKIENTIENTLENVKVIFPEPCVMEFSTVKDGCYWITAAESGM